MKSIKNILMAITLLLSITIANAQIKNAKTETVKIYGNCGMCETTIENAGNLKKVAQVDWDKDTKMATLTFDSTKTNQDEILKRIALAGYDSEKFLAPDTAYNSLAGCCQYEREAKVAVTIDAKTDPSDSGQAKQMTGMENHENHAHAEIPKTDQVAENQLKPVFENYFLLKDALVKTDGKVASSLAKDLLTSLNEVKMNELAMDVHMVWMKVMKDLTMDAKSISETQDIKKQRTVFMSLSKNMYDLMKVAKYETPVFYQFCPMANGGKGANWLSKDNAIKNPYYGSQMMSCGKTVETIK
jgi:copper chaperone CopZ